MKTRLLTLTILAMAIFSLLFVGTAGAFNTSVEEDTPVVVVETNSAVDKMAPDFTATNIDTGDNVKFSEFSKGSVTVLAFW